MENAWAVKPNWAEEVEAEEAKHGPLLTRTVDEEAFPSLGEAAKAKPGGKKTKPVKMALGAFMSSARKPLTDKEILASLPKGSSGQPREERDASALGGGFKDYGGNRDGFRGHRDERDEREPSRADAVDDWGAERKFTPSSGADRRGGGGGGFGGGGFRDREGGFGDRPPREDRGPSEADTADDWGANRKFTPTADADRRGGGGGFGGGGFRDRDGGGSGGSFRDRDGPSRADEGDWGARRGPPPGPDRDGAAGPSGRRGYGFSDTPVSAADVEDKWSHRAPLPGDAGPGGGGGGAAERPRLKLAPRTKPLPDLPPPASQQQQQAANGAGGPSTPTSEAGSSGSGQAAAAAAAAAAEPRPKKSNPFGAARPREEVLKEKGIDYQKEELKLEHGEVIRDATPEETEMEKEVEELRLQLASLKEASPDEADTINELSKELDSKEKALYKLQAELDDRVRFSKNRPEREPAPRAPPADDNGAGFEVVRNQRRERATAAAGGEAGRPGSTEPEHSDSHEHEAAGGGGSGAPGGAWGRGAPGGGAGGSFRDRDGPRGGAPGGFREGPPPPRERRANESLAGRTGGGW